MELIKMNIQKIHWTKSFTYSTLLLLPTQIILIIYLNLKIGIILKLSLMATQILVYL